MSGRRPSVLRRLRDFAGNAGMMKWTGTPALMYRITLLRCGAKQSAQGATSHSDFSSALRRRAKTMRRIRVATDSTSSSGLGWACGRSSSWSRSEPLSTVVLITTFRTHKKSARNRTAQKNSRDRRDRAVGICLRSERRAGIRIQCRNSFDTRERRAPMLTAGSESHTPIDPAPPCFNGSVVYNTRIALPGRGGNHIVFTTEKAIRRRMASPCAAEQVIR